MKNESRTKLHYCALSRVPVLRIDVVEGTKHVQELLHQPYAPINQRTKFQFLLSHTLDDYDSDTDFQSDHFERVAHL